MYFKVDIKLYESIYVGYCSWYENIFYQEELFEKMIIFYFRCRVQYFIWEFFFGEGFIILFVIE